MYLFDAFLPKFTVYTGIVNIAFSGKGGQISRVPLLFRRVPDHMEQFTKVTSICQEFSSATDENFSIQWLLYSAKNYKLTGMTLSEICDHNASVATELGRYEVCTQTGRHTNVHTDRQTPIHTHTNTHTNSVWKL